MASSTTTAAVGSRRGWGPAVCGIVPLVLAATGLGLSLSRPRFDNLVTGHDLGDAAMALACGLVAALILSRRPRHPVGLAFAAIGVADGLALVASGLSEVIDPGQAGYRWVVWLSEWTWVPGLLLAVTVLPLVFPEGVNGRVQRALWRTDVALIVAVCLGQAFSTKLHSGAHTTINNPVGIRGADLIGGVAIAAALVCAAASLTSLVVQFVRADHRLRRQMLPLIAAGVIVVAAVSVAELLGTAGVVLQDSCFLLIPAAALLSVLRLRLYDIEVAIGRSVSWVALSGLLIGSYVLIVEVASSWLHVHGRVGSVFATAVIAVAFGPLRAALQRAIARWLYGDRGDPYAALADTTQVLSGGADPIGALRQATDDLAYRLRSPGVRILRDGVLLVGTGVGRAAIAVPLRAGVGEVGRLEIVARSVGETFSRADERLVLDLCAPLTNAVAAVGLIEELRSSRERLALAREAERRRVRGELHDDVGPSLAAVALQAETARRRLDRNDTAGVRDSLALLHATIQRAASDLRSAIDALGPRALEEVGLPDAVRALAAADDDPAVTVHIGQFGPLPAAVEVAAYRAIAEALTNARRHAHATGIVVQLCVTQDQLVLTVSDDGVGGVTGRPGGAGGVTGRPGGVGIGSMRARIEELGGDFSIGTGEHGTGTVVTARVPVGSAAEVIR